MKLFWVLLGSFVIIAIFTIITILLIKWLSKFYNSLYKEDSKILDSEKKIWLRIIYILFATDFETEKKDMIISIIVIAFLICGYALYNWISHTI